MDLEVASPLCDRVIEDFLKDFEENTYLAYGKLCDCARKILADELHTLGIKHEIYDRGSEGSIGGKAKAPASARQTVVKRQNDRGQKYETKEEIICDMHDLAGLRVALYYPNDFAKVEKLIVGRFVEVKPPQDWPDQRFGPFRYPTLDSSVAGRTDISGRQSRFPGYFARHYRVKLRDSDVSEPAVGGKILEVQLMTLLMHAWSKMHYELIYKPRAGFPRADEDDERLLDISCGIIIAGEQVLRQIQINLDRKREQGRLPFNNSHNAWSYLEEKWVNNRDIMLSESQRLWLRGASLDHRRNHRQILYKSLEMLGFNTPEWLDRLVRYCIDTYGNTSGILTAQNEATSPEFRGDHGNFVDMLILSLTDLEEFATTESEQLLSPRLTSRSPSRSESAKLARYKALIICNALRRCQPRDWNAVWMQPDRFATSYPSGQEFLALLHPRSLLKHKPEVIANLHNFCDYLLSCGSAEWKLRCAEARLTWLQAEIEHWDDLVDGIPALEFSMTVCPWGLIYLLDHGAKEQNTSVGQVLERVLDVLECGEGGDPGLGEHERDSLSIPMFFGAVYRAISSPGLDSGSDLWIVDDEMTSGVTVHVGFPTIRRYLNRPDMM